MMRLIYVYKQMHILFPQGQVHLGTIGDRKIELKHNGAFDLPTIKIFTVRLGGAEPQLITEEIVYINRPT